MNEQIIEIVHRHCETIKNEVNTDNIAKAIKSIDQIVQKMYHDLYGIKDIRYNNDHCKPPEIKHGHCC